MDPNNIMNPIATIQLNQIEDWNKWHNLHRHTVVGEDADDCKKQGLVWRCDVWTEDQIQEWKVHRQSVPYALFRMCGERSLIQVWNGRTYFCVRCERSLSTYCSVTFLLSLWRSVRQSKHGWKSSGWSTEVCEVSYWISQESLTF